MCKLLCFSDISRILAVVLAIALSSPLAAQELFGIQFVDQQTNRPIPLVEIETVHHQKWVSDNQGWISVDESDLIGSEVFFEIRSHGYDYPKDGFGFSGKTIACTPGDRLTIPLKRSQPAERLYRTTGIGRYVHSEKLGVGPSFTSENSHNANVFESPVGCDSVLTAVIGQKMHWFWGDTQALHYPIGGGFHMTGATTDPASMDIDSQPPRFTYFRDQRNRIAPMAHMPGDGPTWISGLTVLKDDSGDDVLLANYVKIRNELEAYRRGLSVGILRQRDLIKSLSFSKLHCYSHPLNRIRSRKRILKVMIHTFIFAARSQTAGFGQRSKRMSIRLSTKVSLVYRMAQALKIASSIATPVVR